MPTPRSCERTCDVARLWLSDTDDGIRELYADLAPHGQLLTPEQLAERLDAGERPASLLIDGASLQRLPADIVDVILGLPRLAVCTGRSSEIAETVSRAGQRARVLEKPFSLEDFELLLDWLSEKISTA